ncbi:hypothetical protein DXI23_11555 [Marinobacter flavimaris]|uniref:Uncharacterized protein n=1 Tax=Marinobacter flavimaris TaxID=262076 RepID=A0A3D8H467_9GAMM|nr:restriction endonuclease [Marinobacter flavimaris]PPI78454.1 hypothetical protein MDHKLMBL_19915 [Marinobacter flavimaris]RDU41149.1 hypothetical protein DXI23_11555 [Marinobacter flavimaris]
MAYNLTVLDPFEFEELVCDIFTKKFDELIESFKVGADQGIDLRHICADKNATTIFQCKRYDENGFYELKRSAKKEKEKIDLLAPEKYVLVTSIPLSPKNKKELLDILKPWCKSESDILGKNEINTLLSTYPSVLKKHFKLWISSTTILESILHSHTFNYTDNEIESFIEDLPKMVIHEGFYRCKDIVENHNHVLISGDPGIGKTTVAKLLMLDFMSAGYEVAFVGTNIDEAWSLLHKTKEENTKLAIVYDDFLGRTDFNENKLTKNEDRRILDLIKKCEKSSNTKLILTTREYIFEDAKRQHGALHDNEREFEKYAIKLDDYTKKNKAQILFNHLYFSKLPESKLVKFVESKIYNILIYHKNFNPRIIATFCNSKTAKQYTDDEYIEYIKKAFSNPVAIWEKPFHDDISETAKIILLILLSLDGQSHFDELRSLTSKTIKRPTSLEFETEFLNSLKQLEGNFTKTQRIKSETESTYLVRFSNPSIEDFLINLSRKNPSYIRDIVDSIQFFSQITHLIPILVTKEPPNNYKSDLIEELLKKTISLEGSFRKRPIASFNRNSLFWYTEGISVFSVIAAALILREAIHKRIPEELLEKMTKTEFWNEEIKKSAMPGNVTSQLGALVGYIAESNFYDDYEKHLFEKSLRKSILTDEHIDSFAMGLDDVINLEYVLTKIGKTLSYDEMDFLLRFTEMRILPDLVGGHDLDELEHALNAVEDSFLRSSVIEDEISIRLAELEDVRERMSKYTSSHGSGEEADKEGKIDLDSMFSGLKEAVNQIV